MDEQGLKKLLKLAFEAGYDYYADTYFDNEFKKSFDEWYDEQKLLQHGVMQAEGSDGAKEAAVGNSADGQSRRDRCWFRNRGRGKRCKCTSKCLLEE